MTTIPFVRKMTRDQMTLRDWLLLSCVFSCLLVTARVLVTGYVTYLFLIWNLFLGFVPYAISQWAATKIASLKGIKLVGVLITWLLFIPNSFYILTDLFHLSQFNSAPKWFDLLLIFSFAWNGLLLGALSVRKIETIMFIKSGRGSSLLVVLIVMWLNSFGVYIGRYLRYNSWDVITQPFSLFSELFEILLHPLRNRMEWGMITVYAVFMTVAYITLKKMGEDFQHHHQQPKN